MQAPIYLDYASTTPVDPAVAEAMAGCLTREGNFANPASRSHLFGWQAEEAVEAARGVLAKSINADPREIVWTSGATESNNLAIKGSIEANTEAPIHIITSQIEHKSVLDVCDYLQVKNCQVTYIAPEASGHVSVSALIEAVQENTRLISLMHANNETGAINAIEALGCFCRERGILLHVDAAQTLGKIPLDVKALNVDLMSVSAHKTYGPKGIGALYVRRHPDVRVRAQIHGGGHERGMRSGTLAIHQIVGFAKAVEVALSRLETDRVHLEKLSAMFLDGLSQVSGVQINSAAEQRLPGINNIAFEHIDGETLLLSLREFALSSGSACTSASVEPSHVLRAMGLSDQMAHNSLRFSFGRYTQASDVELVLDRITKTITTLSAQASA